MRVKTSITLSKKTLTAIDRAAGRSSNRSRVIEEAVELFLAARARADRDRRELDILNRRADADNAQMADVLEYQAEP